MNWLMFVTLLVAYTATPSSCKCENPSAYPVMFGDKYLCGVLFQERGHPDAYFGCNGPTVFLEDEHHETAGDGLYYPMGSLVIKPGCTFYGYKEFNYNGEKKVFPGPALLSEVPGLVSGEDSQNPNGFRSFLCDCSLNYINCVPTDNFEVVLYCDASDATTETVCRYSKTIGTSFSSSLSESMSIDSTIEASIKESFFGIFESTLSTSVTTGYNWGTVSEEAMSEQVTVDVEATAPPGFILVIEQAAGHCGDSTVKTEMYKISHTDPTGVVIKSKIVEAKDLVAALKDF